MKTKKTVTIYFKSGQSVSLRCDDFTVTHGDDGGVRGWKAEGMLVDEDHPLYIDPTQIIAVMVKG